VFGWVGRVAGWFSPRSELQVGDPAQFGHITQFIRQIAVNQSAVMNGRRCPFCHSDSSRVVGIRVDSWAKCQNCRSVFRDITPARFQQIHDEAFVSFPSSADLAAGARPAACVSSGSGRQASALNSLSPRVSAAGRVAGSRRSRTKATRRQDPAQRPARPARRESARDQTDSVKSPKRCHS
jgi:transposase-like protein